MADAGFTPFDPNTFGHPLPVMSLHDRWLMRWGGDDVVVSVADTGAGIGAQDIQRVFNPLFTTKSGGMGLGLSICRSIVEGHHGRLGVVPNIPKGAVFQIALPAHVAGFGEDMDR